MIPYFAYIITVAVGTLGVSAVLTAWKIKKEQQRRTHDFSSRKDTYLCGFCGKKGRLVRPFPCSHLFCNDCLTAYRALESMRNRTEEIECPVENCNKRYPERYQKSDISSRKDTSLCGSCGFCDDCFTASESMINRTEEIECPVENCNKSDISSRKDTYLCGSCGFCDDCFTASESKRNRTEEIEWSVENCNKSDSSSRKDTYLCGSCGFCDDCFTASESKRNRTEEIECPVENCNKSDISSRKDTSFCGFCEKKVPLVRPFPCDHGFCDGCLTAYTFLESMKNQTKEIECPMDECAS